MAREDRERIDGGVAAGETEAGYWRGVVEEQVRSGLSQDAFCQQRGLPQYRFHYWKYTKLPAERRRLRDVRREELGPRLPALVPVEVLFSPPALQPPSGPGVDLARSAPESSGVEVVLPRGLRVAVQRGFDVSVLREVVGVLGC